MEGIILDISTKSQEEIEKYGIDNTIKHNESDLSGSILKERSIQDVYISDKEMEELRKAYSHSIVQDFRDEYHMPEEERERLQKKNEKFFTLKKSVKHKIRRLDYFVNAYRLCFDIIDDVAKNNGVYSPEKFKKKVLSGEIKIYGLHFPKYVGSGKKNINWKYIAEFIDDRSKDPAELMINDDIDFDDNYELSLEDKVNQYFSEDEINEIFKEPTKEEEILLSRAIVDPNTEEGVATVSSKKDTKNLIKMSPVILKELKQQRKRENKNRRIGYNSYTLEESDFNFIDDYDSKNFKHHKNSMPKFKGDIMNDDDVERYLLAMDIYEKEHEKVEYYGKSITIEEKNEMDVKAMLESAGWNIRNCWGNKEKEKKMNKIIKEEKKREKRLKEMLADIKHRQNIRDGKVSEKDLKKKKKKKKKFKKEKDRIILDMINGDESKFKKCKKKNKKNKKL